MRTGNYLEEKKLLDIQEQRAKSELQVKQYREILESVNNQELDKSEMLLRHALEIFDLSILYHDLWIELKEKYR